MVNSMSLILGLLIIYIGIQYLKKIMMQEAKRRYYTKFKYYLPRDITVKTFKVYFNKLLTFEPPRLKETQELEYLAARMRTLEFPDGIYVTYRGRRIDL